MDPVRLGIIGCGAIGRRHAEAASRAPAIRLQAVADMREQVAREVAASFGAGRVYSTAEGLIDDPDVEGVVLAFPACTRTGIALRAIGQGKHVLLEKPVAMNADEVRRLIAARGGLTAGCCSARFRFYESAGVVSDFIATGALGPIRVARCRALTSAGEPPKTPPPDWRLKRALNGGGIMSNWGCYDLDYLLGITGWSLKPTAVLAQTWQVGGQFDYHASPGSDAETHVAAVVRCEGGATLLYERGEFTASSPEGDWGFVGEHGALHLDMLPGRPKRMVFDEGISRKGVVSRTLWEGQEDWGHLHASPSRDFAEAIRAGRQPTTSLEQALVVQQITDGIYASAAAGRSVEIA